VTGSTTTTTLTSDHSPDPTATDVGFVDIWDGNDYLGEKALFASLASDYLSLEAVIDGGSVPTPTVPAGMPCVTVRAWIDDTRASRVSSWQHGLIVGGEWVCNRVVRDCGCTAWSDDTCKSGYAMSVDTNGMGSSIDVVLTVPGVAGPVAVAVPLERVTRDYTCQPSADQTCLIYYWQGTFGC
jgi:hypothetical protein